MPFASRGLYGLSRLSVWWLRLGIDIERITPGRSRTAATSACTSRSSRRRPGRPPRTALQQQARFDAFRDEFNRAPARGPGHEDPGRGLPPSPRPFAGLPELAYPFHDRDVIVARTGAIGLHGRRVIISTVLEGQRLGLREVDTDVWLVSFMHYDLGYVDLEARTLQTIDTRSPPARRMS